MLANYREERELIASLFGKQCDERQKIIALRGEAGSGKSTLLRTCLRDKTLPLARITGIDLRQKTGVAALLIALVEKLETDHLPYLGEKIANLTQPSQQIIEVTGNTTKGWKNQINNQITVLLQRETSEERLERQHSLTSALVEALSHSPDPVVVAFDQYDAGVTEEIQMWLGGEFLPRVIRTEQVRVVVAGQTWPQGHDGIADWTDYCTKRELGGVREAHEWLPVAEAMGRTKPPDASNLHDVLATFCYMYKGNPSEIIKAIEGLPRKIGVNA